MNPKLIAIVVVVICFLCSLLTAGGIALFGSFSNEDECVYRGPFAPESGECKDEDKDSEDDEDNDESDNDDSDDNANNDNDNDSDDNSNDGDSDNTVKEGYEKYDALFYTFQYPTNYFLDDSKYNQIFVYSQDPATAKTGNENIIFQELNSSFESDITEDLCKQYSDELVDELEIQGAGAYKDLVVVDVSVHDLNGNDSCRIETDATVSGVKLTQIYYTLPDPVYSTYSYLVLITILQDSKNLETFETIAGTFELL